MSIEILCEALRECGSPHAPELVDRLTKPQTYGAGEQYATITAHSVTVPEGTATVEVPITISAESEEQTVEGIVLTVCIEKGSDVINGGLAPEQKEAFAGSLFSEHQHAILGAQPWGACVRYLAMPYMPPFGEVKASGVVCTAVVDTSKFKEGETYRINTAANGLSSAVAITNPDPNSLSYQPVALSHKSGSIEIVAKR